jgi:phosphoglycolate phosphatase
MSLKAVIFDFDGTLARLNTDFSLMRSVILDLISAYNIPLDNLRDLFVLEMIEAGRSLISRADPSREASYIKEAKRLVSGIEIRAAKEGGLIDGVRQMLGELNKRNIKMGVVTRNCSEAVREVFPDIDLFCKAVITREFTPNVKPHPGHIRTALDALDIRPEYSAMVGDHPMDIGIGKEVGAYTIGVLTGYSQADSLHEAGADLVINSAAQIVKCLP